MATTKQDIKGQQDKLRLKSELLALRVKKMDLDAKIKDTMARLKRMGGR